MMTYDTTGTGCPHQETAIRVGPGGNASCQDLGNLDGKSELGAGAHF